MTNPTTSLRLAKLTDLNELQKLFADTISTVCKNDYSPEQLKAWISSIENTQRWIDKLTSQYFLIAERSGSIVGYASLEHNNYIDFLYVHKNYQRQGIADRLYQEIETEAVKNHSTDLYSDVSKTAKAFFEKKGFHTLAEQTIIRQNVEIVNYKMTKRLNKET